MKKSAVLSLVFLVWAFAAVSGTAGAADPAEPQVAPPASAQSAPAGAEQAKPDEIKPVEKTALPAFGYDIFRALPEPIVEGPVDDEYLLSPGDEVVISVWGQLNLKHALVVSEDGFIDIPEEGGRVFTSGASLKELRRMVTESLSRIYASYIDAQDPGKSTAFVDVKLGKVRKLLVYVMGEVKNQGPYTVGSGVATLLNLLSNADGVKETGSLREIKVRRADGVVESVDLYEFLMTGKMEPKRTRLRYGDYVIVPLKGKSVTVRGEVKRPGIYEAVGTEGVRDLVRFAGGLTANAYLKRVQVRRFEPNAGEKILDVDGERVLNDPAANLVLRDGDEVTFFPNVVVRRSMVEIGGEGIKRPGTYEFRAGMRVADLISAAEGLKEYVYLERADLVRTREDFSKEMTIFALKDLYREKGGARGVYEFAAGTAAAEGANFALKEMDQVRIYSAFDIKGKEKYVALEGQVKEPGKYVLPENMRLYDFIFARGGFQDEEFRKKAYLELGHIFRKVPGEYGEKVMSFNLGRLLAGEAEENVELRPDDRIVVYSYETMKTKPYVTIEGLVKRPGQYDLTEGLTLEDLIMVAGGLRPDAYKVEAVVARTSQGEGIGTAGTEQTRSAERAARVSTLVIPIAAEFATIPAEKRTPIEIYDKIVVRNLPDWEPLPVVSIEGQVNFPGSYSLPTREERVSKVIGKAGGIKKEGLASGAVLYRRKDIVRMESGRVDAVEKVAIRLDKALDDPEGPFDLLMRDGDRVFVPLNPGTVEVKGAVRNPAIFQYKAGKGLKYYVDLAGGYEKIADKSGAVVRMPNGAAARVKASLFGGPKMLPGSIVDVPYQGEASEVEIVEVRGAVKRPRIAAWRKGEKLEYYIKLAGGFDEGADSAKTVVYLEDGKILEAEGDGLAGAIIAAGSVIEVPEKEKPEAVAPAGEVEIVEIRGAVKRPRAVAWRKGEKLEYYVKLAGGYDKAADSNAVIVYLEDGKVLEAKGAGGLSDTTIAAGSVIEVPGKR